MKLIGLGIFSITIIYPLLSPFSHLLRTIVSNKFKYTMTKGLVKGGLMYIAEIILGCIYVIYKFYSAKVHAKKIKRDTIKMEDDFTFLEQDEKKVKYPKKIYLFAFLLSLSDLLTFMLPTVNSQNSIITEFYYELKYSNIIFMSILCKYFLAVKLYNHQFVGTAIMIIGMSINIIKLFSLYSEKIFGKDFVLSICLFFVCFILISIQIVCTKKLYIKYRISPYELLLYEGLFGFVSLTLISFYVYLTCPFNFCGKSDKYFFIEDLIELFKKHNDMFLFCILFILASLLVNFFARLTVYYFSPTTESVSNSLSSMLFWILSRFVQNDDSIKDYITSYIPFIGYCFLVIGSLLYNEIIIFYPCGLSVNTKKEVRIRASNDILLYKESVKEISLGVSPLIEEKESETDDNNLQ